MKKLIFIMMVAAATTSAFGINPNVSTVFSKMNNETTLKYISNYLNADDSQIAELESIFYCTDQLLKSSKNEAGESYAASAVNYNLTSMKNVLSNAQYRKYLVLVNLSITNAENNMAVLK
jgi:hypothetical protein